MKRDCCTGISPVRQSLSLFWQGTVRNGVIELAFCISCTIIKNCEVYTRYHWERRITP